MDFLMTNPSVKLGDVAIQFGVTQAWLSTVIHSDAFQALLREKQDIAFHSTVLPVREKLMALAHQTLDRMQDMIPMETEVGILSRVAEGVLDRLGYGTKPSVLQINNIQNNHTTVLKGELEEARLLMNQVSSLPLVSLGTIPSDSVEVFIDGERSPIALPRASAEVSRESPTRVGETIESTHFYQTETKVISHSEREAGVEV